MEKRVAIVGAGVSGLAACKCIVEKGFRPTVFEAQGGIGGVWAQTIESTRLQNVKEAYQYSDFPWPPSVKEMYPSHDQVVDYLESYARHFQILPFVKFNTKVTSIDYVGESDEEMQSWDRWGGTGKAFGSKGKWHISVQDTKNCTTEVYQFEFLILCIGRFSGVPNTPEFPSDCGPEVFGGTVMHSMDYSAMDNASAAELIKNKRIAIIGSQKSAVDIAVECANANGTKCPCTMIQRTVHWMLPSSATFWGVSFGFLFTRFSELLVHKPGESFLHSLLATLLSPLINIYLFPNKTQEIKLRSTVSQCQCDLLQRWGISKLAESYLKWTFPLKEYDMIPKQSFLQVLSLCKILLLPKFFYEKVKDGSIVLKKSQGLNYFCKEGIIVNGEAKPLEADLVILATGYNGAEKLKRIFESQTFQKCIMGSSNKIIPLYRQIVHPRIPQLAIIGYAESLANLPTAELVSQWLGNFLRGTFELPSVREMEKDVKMWDDYTKRYGGTYFRRSCIAYINIWYNDQLCKDMGVGHKRKKGFWAELFEPYGPLDYAGLTHQ